MRKSMFVKEVTTATQRAGAGFLLVVSMVAGASAVAAEYDLVQATHTTYEEGVAMGTASISDDGRRVAFLTPASSGVQWQIAVYESDDDRVRDLHAHVRGSELHLIADNAQISGDGTKVVFSALGFYTEERSTGVFLYDLEDDTLRLLAADAIPRRETGEARIGEPGMRKYVNTRPSISRDGRSISYVRTDYVYSGATEITGHARARA